MTMTRKQKSNNVKARTKGQIEAEISNALVSFEREHMGRGPVEAKTYIKDDIVMIRLKRVLTPAEKYLAADTEGAKLVKQVRAKLLENARGILETLISDITKCQTTSFHTDISTQTGERFIIITLSEDLERRFAIVK
jgi:uncharacterized protein YbcI